MSADELQEALDREIAHNAKLSQMVMELCQKLSQASAVIESLMKKLEERSVK